MKISYDYHTNSVGDMDEKHIPASMAAVERAIREAYPEAEIEITLDKGRINPVSVTLSEAEEEEHGAGYSEHVESAVSDIANIAWAQY